MTPDPESSGSPLPVPYSSPWRRLATDLTDAGADLRLRLWELLRRNREGSLPLPAFWPRTQAALFWPLILALVLAALLTLALLLRPALPPMAAPAAPTSAPEAAPSAAMTAPGPRLEPERPVEALPSPAGEDGVPSPPRAGEPQPEAEAAVEAEVEVEEAAQPPAEPPSPLGAALAAADPDRLILAIRSDDAEARLELTLSDDYGRLPEADRRRRVELWQEQALLFFYQRLELQDRQGRPLGRSALVGGGMVLLEPPP